MATANGYAGGDEVAVDRDFYRQLLCLNGQSEIRPLIARAVALIRDVTSALSVYVELGTSEQSEDERWWIAQGLETEDLERVRHSLSRGIIAEALATGQTIRTASALADPRFSTRRSVKKHEINAVLCAPVGTAPPIGVVYLQGRATAGPFRDEDEQRVELLARQLAPLADRLIERHRRARSEDQTRSVRRQFACETLVGRSSALAGVLRQAALVAPLELPVLILGASGTGKTALAQLIVRNSRRSAGPLVELNCAALPETLLESELFGAARGAHSTANRSVSGKIAAAEGGTLFLDEVAELSLGSQAKLLQLLQSGRYHPLGSNAPVQANVRIISATNADLQQAVAERRFREDLFYRLHVIPLHMPALSERREDIPALVSYFLERSAQRHGLAPRTATTAALLACSEAAWPGNVRQLAHALEAAAVRAHGEGSAQVEPHHVFPEQRARSDGAPRALSFQEATRHFQRNLLQQTLESNEWNVSAAARALELTRAHTYNLIHAHGLARGRGRDDAHLRPSYGGAPS